MSRNHEMHREKVVIRLPDDPVTRAAIVAKRNEYAQRVASRAGEYIHPENAALQGLLQGNTYCFDMLARMELIDAIAAAEEGVDLEEFTEGFLERHPMFAGTGPESRFAEFARFQVMSESMIIHSYCNGDIDLLSGGTGLQIPPQND